MVLGTRMSQVLRERLGKGAYAVVAEGGDEGEEMNDTCLFESQRDFQQITSNFQQITSMI